MGPTQYRTYRHWTQVMGVCVMVLFLSVIGITQPAGAYTIEWSNPENGIVRHEFQGNSWGFMGGTIFANYEQQLDFVIMPEYGMPQMDETVTIEITRIGHINIEMERWYAATFTVMLVDMVEDIPFDMGFASDEEFYWSYTNNVSRQFEVQTGVPLSDQFDGDDRTIWFTLFGAFLDIDVDLTWTVSVLTPEPEPIPEPASILLLGTGLLGAAGFRRKYKRNGN